MIHYLADQRSNSKKTRRTPTEEMDIQPTSLDSNSARTGSSHVSNKRKNNMGGERIVVSVKVQGNGKKQRSEGSPSDCWSWRKYGQKPIKGSPYPRGYYRCSTSKSCSAKKRVERCKTDASMLIITYTCAHNHPCPDNPTSSQKQEPEETPKRDQEPESRHEQESPVTDVSNNNIDQQDHFQYSKSPFNSPRDHLIEENPFAETTGVLIYHEDLQPSSLPVDFSKLKSEENDFYDELEELPTSSFFTALMRSDFCERRILLDP